MKRNLVLGNRFYDLGPVVMPRGDNEAYGFKIYKHRLSKKHRHSRRVRESIVFICSCGVPLCQGFVVQAMDTRTRRV